MRDVHFWFVVLIRGLVALMAGSLVLIIPDMAKTLLLLPFAVAVSIICLALYGVLDSTLVLISSFMTESPWARAGLNLQGVAGITLGVLFASVLFDHIQLTWFLSLAAIQALSAAVGEFVVARHAKTRPSGVLNYSAAIIASCAGLLFVFLRLLYGASLTPREVSICLYGYLIAFGIAQCLTAAQMLYSDRAIIAESLQ